MADGTLQIRAWCKCGASLDVTASPPRIAEQALDEFRLLHAGEGHGPCDARGASNARRREDRKRRAAMRERIQALSAEVPRG